MSIYITDLTIAPYYKLAYKFKDPVCSLKINMPAYTLFIILCYNITSRGARFARPLLHPIVVFLA